MVWKGNVPPINETISIIGAGHLGKTLAQMLIECGFPKEKLMISYGGKISTFESIKKAGLIENFTVGVCLPAALLIANKKRLNVDHAIGVIEKEYTGFREIHVWAKNVLPAFGSEKEEEKYIEHMSTKGGITETIVESLNYGDTFLDALRKGIARSKEISTFARLQLSDIS